MIENENVYISYTANGTQREWEFPYKYEEGDDIGLYISHNDVLNQIPSTDYIFNTTTNRVKYPADDNDPAVPAGDIVLIMRKTDITQEESSLINNFKSNDIERMADKLTEICQELSDKLGRALIWNPTQEYNTNPQTYLDQITTGVTTATNQAGIATTKAGEAATSASNALASEGKAQKWAEGSDADVTALGGTHSAKGWAEVAQSYVESTDVHTVASNIEDIQTVAANISDVNTVVEIKNDVSTVAAIDDDVSTVATNATAVSNVNTNISAVTGVNSNISTITAVNSNSSNINAVAGNSTNINAVAGNATNINAVNANKTNIDTVAGSAADINTVATNITDVNDVADTISDISAVAADLTKINSVADDLTNIDAVSDDLTNIDLVAGSLSDIQDKQNKVLTTPITVDGTTQTTVEGALGAINTFAAGKQNLLTAGENIQIAAQYAYSGFSANDSIAIPGGFTPGSSSWEIVCHIRTGSDTYGQKTFFCSASAEYRGVSMAITNGYFVSYLGEDNRWISDGSVVVPTSPDTEYYCKTTFDGVNTYTNSISTDGITFTGDQIVTDSTPISGSTVAKFGYLLFNNMNAFNGKLYMPGTYIKVNGEYVFDGNTAVQGVDYTISGTLTVETIGTGATISAPKVATKTELAAKSGVIFRTWED